MTTEAQYEAVLADHRRLVRELDFALNGVGGARQASLCDLVAQFENFKLPCDVKLPMATTITRGCKLSTLILALYQRVGRPDEETKFYPLLKYGLPQSSKHD